VTYPVVAGYAAMTPPERRSFRASFSGAGRSRPTAAPELRALLERRSAHHLAAATCQEFAEQAIQLVDDCGFDVHHTRQFEELARYVANRAG
jgi:hypothetical protein